VEPDEKNRHRIVWTATFLVLLPGLYVASFGPAMKLPRGASAHSHSHHALDRIIQAIYWPLGRATLIGSPFIRTPLKRYLRCFSVSDGNARYLEVPICRGDIRWYTLVWREPD